MWREDDGTVSSQYPHEGSESRDAQLSCNDKIKSVPASTWIDYEMNEQLFTQLFSSAKLHTYAIYDEMTMDSGFISCSLHQQHNPFIKVDEEESCPSLICNAISFTRQKSSQTFSCIQPLIIAPAKTTTTPFLLQLPARIWVVSQPALLPWLNSFLFRSPPIFPYYTHNTVTILHYIHTFYNVWVESASVTKWMRDKLLHPQTVISIVPSYCVH